MSVHRHELPKLVLCVIGDEEFAETAKTLLEDEGANFEVQEADPRMVEAFKYSASRIWPSLTDHDFKQIARHRSVVYVVSDNYPADEAIHEAHEMLSLGAELLEAGGLAMKCECSGISHARSHWLELSAAADRGLEIASDDNQSDDATLEAYADFWTALVQAFVQLPIVTNDDYYTCGMHLLGCPDLIIGLEAVQDLYEDEDEPDAEAAGLMLMLALSILMEDREEGQKPGGVYHLDDELPDFQLTWEACTDYEAGDLFFNPFGRLRIEPVA